MKKGQKIFIGILYWIWQLTWGCLMTIPGLIVSLFCIVFLKGKVYKNGFSYVVEIGDDWGGVCLGCVALCCKCKHPSATWDDLRAHEFGHSVQQLILGPLFLFLVGIPSFIRYWYQTRRDKRCLPNKPYDYAIYEYTASKWGYAWINKIEGTNLVYTYKRIKINRRGLIK